MSADMYQNIIIHFSDKPRMIVSIPAQLEGGEVITKVEVTEPMPLPQGVTWEHPGS